MLVLDDDVGLEGLFGVLVLGQGGNYVVVTRELVGILVLAVLYVDAGLALQQLVDQLDVVELAREVESRPVGGQLVDVEALVLQEDADDLVTLLENGLLERSVPVAELSAQDLEPKRNILIGWWIGNVRITCG